MARPDDPVWNEHQHGKKAWNLSGIESKVVSLAQVISGQVAVRSNRSDITFSERGNAQGSQFHAVCGLIYEKALSKGVGREIPTEWFLQDIRD